MNVYFELGIVELVYDGRACRIALLVQEGMALSELSCTSAFMEIMSEIAILLASLGPCS